MDRYNALNDKIAAKYPSPPYPMTPPAPYNPANYAPLSPASPSGRPMSGQGVPQSPSRIQMEESETPVTSPVSYVDPSMRQFPGQNQTPLQQLAPHRPQMPTHQFTEPYIAPPRPPSQQAPTFQIPQFEHPYQGPPVKQNATTDSLLAPPALPTRPTSAPPGQTDDYQRAYGSPPNQSTGSSQYVDDPKSHGVARFVGNMLPVRLARSGVSTITSTAKLPMYLSPWGDNNPMVLPNLRKRDVALAGVSHMAFGALSPSALSVVGSSIKHATTFLTEQAVHEGIHKMASKKGHAIRRQAGIITWDLRVKHKLIGEEAEIVLLNERTATHPRDCARGWLCPYLYSTGRTPQLPRAKDFTIAQFVSPGLLADADLAPTLLSSLAEAGAPITPFCPWQSPHPTFPRFQRLAIFLLGISPYRNSWSQSRIPNEARISCHVFTHIPAIVLPVKPNCPVVAWSPWTLEQMTVSEPLTAPTRPPGKRAARRPKIDMDLAYGEAHMESLMGRVYDAGAHLHELLDFANLVVDRDLLPPEIRGRWTERLGAALEDLVNASVRTTAVLGHDLGGVCDMERAGVAMFRY